MVESNEIELSEAEAEQYDRQIRLWGLESQKRLRASRVLIIGLTGLGAETAKNIILSGVKSVCLQDHENLKEVDLYSQFLAPPDKLGENLAEISVPRAKALNPNVDITAVKTPINQLGDDFFKQFDIVCATGLNQEQLERINNVCREHNVKFLCGDVFGTFGWLFVDLIDHEYSEDVVQLKAPKRDRDGATKAAGESVTLTVKRRAIYVPLQNALSADWSKPELRKRLKKGDPSYFVTKILLRFRDDLGRNPDPSKRSDDVKKLLQMKNELVEELSLPPNFIPEEIFEDVFGQLAPAAAVVGGIMAQEVVKAVSQKEPPHNNMFFFNPLKCLGFVELYGQ